MARAWREPALLAVIQRFAFLFRKMHGTVTERTPFKVVERNWRTEIELPTSKVSLAVKAAGTVRLTVVRATSAPSTVSNTSAGAPGLAIVVSTSMRCSPGESLLASARVPLDDHHVVLVDELALVHVKSQAA